MMVTGMLASDPTVASLGALTVNWPEALTRAVMPPDSLPPEYVYCFSSSYVPAGEWVSAVRSMIFASSPPSSMATSVCGAMACRLEALRGR